MMVARTVLLVFISVGALLGACSSTPVGGNRMDAADGPGSTGGTSGGSGGAGSGGIRLDGAGSGGMAVDGNGTDLDGASGADAPDAADANPCPSEPPAQIVCPVLGQICGYRPAFCKCQISNGSQTWLCSPII